MPNKHLPTLSSSGADAVFTYPWLFNRRTDLALFFLPIFPAAALALLSGQLGVSQSLFWSAILAQGFGLGPFHLGLTWSHYLDKDNLKHYSNDENRSWSLLAPMLVIPLTVLCYVWQTKLAICIYVLWTIQHLVQQNLGVLLLYKNSGPDEAFVDRSTTARSLHASAALFAFIFLRNYVPPGTPLSHLISGIIMLTAAESLWFSGKYLLELRQQAKSGRQINVPGLAFWLLSMVFFAPFALFRSNFAQALLSSLVLHWFQYIGLNYKLVKAKYSCDAVNARRLLSPFGATSCFLFPGLALLGLIAAVDLIISTGSLKTQWQLDALTGLSTGIAFTHYLQDAFIWRLRNEFNRRSLLPYLKPATKRTVPAAHQKLANVRPEQETPLAI